MKEAPDKIGPAKGDFIPPPVLEDQDERADALPPQEEFWRPPTRFGSVPVEKEPLGWDRRKGFRKLFPQVMLPFQVVERVQFGHPDLEPNRLFWGDNLHVMRQLPSESIDLIYIDPPFFSGRNYNVIFGDKNEVRSFSDIWEGGMPGYLVWLNARLYEMKRLLKPTGSIFVHCDWHASHYIKVEMDKIYGYDRLQNEIIWSYRSGGGSKHRYGRKHDTLLWYTKSTDKFVFNADEVRVPYDAVIAVSRKDLFNDAGKVVGSVWDISRPPNHSKEWIGYPTQKPEILLERVIKAHSKAGQVVADFFCGGGTTLAVAQVLNRRWVACDQSRIAVAVAADRMAKVVEHRVGRLFAVPDFTVTHWGIYEAPKLTKFKAAEFREFVVRAFGGKPEGVSAAIHGVRYGVPLFVGEPARSSRVGKEEVGRFAKAVYEERRANHGVMLAWNFGPEARRAAEILAARENKRIDFVRLNLVRLEADEFREHVVSKHKDYGALLSFIQPPEVRVAVRRMGRLRYEFDVSESVSLNKNGAIANVQWDFDYREGRFTSTQGYAFLRDKGTGRPVLVVEHEFPEAGKHTIACSVQDDQGGERTVAQTVEVA